MIELFEDSRARCVSVGGKVRCEEGVDAEASSFLLPGGREPLDAERVIPSATTGTGAAAAVCDLCLLRKSGRVCELLSPAFDAIGEPGLEVRVL